MVGHLQQVVAKVRAAGHHDAGNVAVAHAPEAVRTQRVGQLFEVGQFRVAEHLHAFGGEVGEEPGQRQARPVHRRFADGPVEADALTQQDEIEFVGMVFEELAD